MAADMIARTMAAKALNGDASAETIKSAVSDYLDENPVTAGATAEQAAQIEQNTQDIAERKQGGTGGVTIDHCTFKAPYTDERGIKT